MLRATHRVLKAGAPHCFYVITNSHDLSDSDRSQLARRDGNEHVESPERYDAMMQQAGYTQVEVSDVTEQYAKTLEDWKRAWRAGESELVALVGAEDYARRLGNRDIDIANVADGLLVRCRVYGVRP